MARAIEVCAKRYSEDCGRIDRTESVNAQSA